MVLNETGLWRVKAVTDRWNLFISVCKHVFSDRVFHHCSSQLLSSGWEGRDIDIDSVPSLLFVAKAFETPAVCSALLAIVLYIVKIGLLVKRPNVRRLHLKAAYLTFGAIAEGTSGFLQSLETGWLAG
ncbi:hypothetical protein ACOMHN_066469 [Nucella lapillus]